MIELGKMEKIVDLRTVWKHEAQDFSKWLSQEENLAILSRTIGIDIVFNEVESKVGCFNVDLYAMEEGTNRKIIIENQLGDTDHDHLGKIITYAAGKEADVIIWIVKRARDEHKQAIEWLNQHTDENICFFLIEIELWKIGDSLPAPKFNIVARPNDWARSLKTEDGLSDTKKRQLRFWQSFREFAFSKPEFKSVFSPRKARPQHWYSLGVGMSSVHINLCINTQSNRISANIYFSDDKESFEKFNASKEKIESEIGEKMEWRIAEKDCQIVVFRSGNIKKESSWPEYFDWLCKMSLKLKSIIEKYA